MIFARCYAGSPSHRSLRPRLRSTSCRAAPEWRRSRSTSRLTFTWPSTMRCRAAKAETMRIASFELLGPIRAPRCLAIDRDHLGGGVGQRRHPGHEAKLEGAGVERGKDIAEMIMRGRAVHIGPKPPQQLDLPLAKSRDVGECLRPRKNRQKNQEQHFRERRIHFAGLTMIRQPAEIVKKNSLSPKSLQTVSRRNPSSSSTCDALEDNRFSTSASCHGYLHPIALVSELRNVALNSLVGLLHGHYSFGAKLRFVRGCYRV